MEKKSHTLYRNATTAEQEFASPIFMVVKLTYDSGKRNPYFKFDGRNLDMPEAIDYMLKNAETQIAACGDVQKWVDARLAEMVDVPYEEDENIKPEIARAHGCEPKQLVYMKAAHEYYLAHVVFCGQNRKSYRELQQTYYDTARIFELAKQYPKSFWQTCSFEEAHDKGRHDACSLL